MSPDRFRSLPESAKNAFNRYKYTVLAAAEVGLVTAAMACDKKSSSPPPPLSPTATHQPVPAFTDVSPSPISVQKTSAETQNPFLGQTLFVNPQSEAAQEEQTLLSQGDTTDAKIVDVLAQTPTAKWLTGGDTNITTSVSSYISESTQNNGYPVFVFYNIPDRDCGGYSAGGVKTSNEYIQWVQEIMKGIGKQKVAVILEPDGLGQLNDPKCSAEKAQRLQLMKDTIILLKSNENIAVFVEAAMYVPADKMADMLEQVGIENADGVSLNTAGYTSTTDSETYLNQLNSYVKKPVKAVIDTSRNGKPIKTDPSNPESAWCNPNGAAIGQKPTTDTHNPNVEALLWIKPPGESDGTCNGGSAAGQFWLQKAVSLVKNSQQ